MRTGFRTSEFLLAAKWSLATVGLLAWLLHHPPQTWPGAAVCIPLAVLAWMAGAVTNNYGENRFQLKARAQPQAPSPEDAERGPMGFGALAGLANNEEEEEEEDDDE